MMEGRSLIHGGRINIHTVNFDNVRNCLRKICHPKVTVSGLAQKKIQKNSIASSYSGKIQLQFATSKIKIDQLERAQDKFKFRERGAGRTVYMITSQFRLIRSLFTLF